MDSNSPHSFRSARPTGFTLIELLVSMALLSLLLVVMVSIINQTTKAWTSTQGKIEQFRQARDAFESITRQISQSTLNTYLDYEDSSGNRRPTNSTNFVASRYARQSELRFISGLDLAGSYNDSTPRPGHSIFFQAPLGEVSDTNYSGLQTLLNTWGYYLEYADDSVSRPTFITTATVPYKNRFRLMELMQPSENMSVYGYTSGSNAVTGYNGRTWFTDALTASPPPVHVLAENVIALILLPKLTPQEDPSGTSLSPNYFYSSTGKDVSGQNLSTISNPILNPKNQLPPIVQVTMVAIDETSANRLTASDNLAIKNMVGSLFTNPVYFKDDLATLETFLVGKRINYRVFTTNVSIKGAKWSREQQN